MKRRQPQRPERRRALVELNLAGQPGIREISSRRGCASILGRLGLMVAVVVALAELGLR